MKQIPNLIVISLLFAQFNALHAAEPAVRIEKDVTYLDPDVAEKADLYLPPTFEPGKEYPGIVIIHGGGWTGGDKGAAREINIGTTLASHGYVCMSINYALAKDGSPTFPQNIQECKRVHEVRNEWLFSRRPTEAAGAPQSTSCEGRSTSPRRALHSGDGLA